VRAEKMAAKQRTHDHYGSPTYLSWVAMIARCTNEKHSHWKNYGGRGIAVCAPWRKFENFLADMGERPAGLSLDRIDGNGNYEKSNCRWATRLEQNRNRRKTHVSSADHAN